MTSRNDQKQKNFLGQNTGFKPPYLRTLVVGGRQSPPNQETPSSSIKDVTFVTFENLTKDVLTLAAPEVVLSALVEQSFDAHDLATLLQQEGFRGLYRVMATDVPNADVVRREIQKIAPDLKFELFVIDRT